MELENEIMVDFNAQLQEQYNALSEEDKDMDLDDLLLNFLVKRLSRADILVFFKSKYPLSNILIEDLIKQNANLIKQNAN